MWHTEAILFMKGRILTQRGKKNNSLTFKKHVDFPFNSFAVQKLLFLKWSLSKIPRKRTPSTKGLSLDDSMSCHAVADVTT